MKIFVDTSAFLALEIQNDKYHPQAKKHFSSLENKRALFFTNDYILAEAYTRLIYDIHLTAAMKFHRYINELISKNQLTLLEIETVDREESLIELERYSDHKLSFTDGTVIVNFKKYHLDEIFTFDKHFRDINLLTNLRTT